MFIVFIGPPGAGKGTQSELLVAQLGIPHLSTGVILRAAVAESSPVGKLAAPFLDDGRLVPDALVAGIVAERLDLPEYARGCVLDGFPRNLGQAIAFDEYLEKRGRKLSLVLELRIGREELRRRLLARMRADDALETVARRFEVYRLETEPMLAHYDRQKILRTIDASGTIEAVSERVLSAVETLHPREDY